MVKNAEEEALLVAEEFHKAMTTRDLDGLMKLYREDAVLESSAVLTLERKTPGILRGKKDIRPHFDSFFKLAGKDNPSWLHYNPVFTNDGRLVCEYPSKGPAGESQLDVVESFNIKNGLIAEHRVYWGYVGFEILLGPKGSYF